MKVLSGLFVLLASANLALSQRSTACSSSGVCATLATNNSDVYVQVSAPSSSGWASVGIGRGMSGSLMFVIYPNGSGGVTVSPRLGRGEVEPYYDESFQVETLNGTGISNGRMVANIKCSNCESWNGGKLGNNWIYARNSRQSISSASTSASISEHNDFGTLRGINVAKAQTTSDAPFENFIGGVSSSNGGSGSSTTNKGGDDGEGGSSSTGPGFKALLAHAICMIIAFAVIFPFGGFIIRIPANIGSQRVRIHYALQCLAFILALVGFGLIIWYCEYPEKSHFDRNHKKLGIVPIALLLIQLILGIVHHALYKSRGAAAPKSTRYAHRWLGRFTIVIGIATTASGINLADELGKWEAEGKSIRPLVVAFWVLAAMMVVLWVGAIVSDAVKNSRERQEAPIKLASGETFVELDERKTSNSYSRGARSSNDSRR